MLRILENVSFIRVRRECKGCLFSLEVTVLFHRKDFFAADISIIDSLEHFQVVCASFGFEESNLESNVSAHPRLLSLSSLQSPISIHLYGLFREAASSRR